MKPLFLHPGIRLALVFVSLLFVNPRMAMGQNAYFSMEPVWFSGPANRTHSLALGDVDGDGDLDLICGNRGQSTVLYTNENGMLKTAPAWATELSELTHSVALGDVDGDGDLDLVCGNQGQGNTLYLNDDGVLDSSPAWTSSTAYNTYGMALGDVDEDGDLDLICANTGHRNTIYLNEGGLFGPSPAWTSDLANNTLSATLGDIDGDGDLDVLFGNDGSNTLYINAEGMFSTAPSWSSSPSAWTNSVALGDVDGDGDLDLVCGNSSPPAVLSAEAFPKQMGDSNALYINENGVLATTPGWTSETHNNTFAVALGDVDADGDLDLVCGNWIQVNTLYVNDGGVFSANPVWFSGPANETYGIALGDVNGDGHLDIVCGNSGESNAVYDNETDELSSDPVWSSGLANATTSVGLGDIDSDGDLDLVCGNGPENNTLYLNDAGLLSITPDWSSGPANTTLSVALGDVDSDGDLDLVCGNSPENNTLYLNDAGLLSITPDWSSGPANGTVSVSLGDVDSDGDIDLVCGNNGVNTVYLNGGGMFSTAPSWSSGPASWTTGTALGDIDGDGDLDLVCGNYEQENTLYLNEDGMFSSVPSWKSIPTNLTVSVDLGDVDGDGDLDIVCGNGGASSQGNTLYLNEGGMFSATPVWSSNPLNSTTDVTLADVDGDGWLDLLCANAGQNNTLYPNEGGIFSRDPLWRSGPAFQTYCVSIGDIDDDGDFDLLCGNIGQSNTLYSGISNPAYRGNPLEPRNHLPNNSALLRFVRFAQVDANLYRIEFTGIDVESDPVWIMADYQYSGDPTWNRIESGGLSGRFGPFSTSPDGIEYSLDWDVSQLPFDDRDIILRLRTISVPRRTGLIQNIPAYLKEIGPLEPIRPEISTTTSTLVFDSALTVGDTASVDLVVGNSGNAVLSVRDVGLPSVEMRLDRSFPFDLIPGEKDTLTFYLEPRNELHIAGNIQIQSNDPITPVRLISVSADIRALEISTRLLSPLPEVPLGEAVTVIVTPSPEVRVEKGFLYHREALSVGEFLDSIPLSPSANDFIAVIPGAEVTENDLEYYIKVENSGVFNTDPPGAPMDSVFFQAVQVPASISTSPRPNHGLDFLEGIDIKVLIFLPVGASFEHGTFHYRSGGETDYHQVDIQDGDALPFAAIPDSIPGPRGLEYWAEVQTLTRKLTDPPSTPAETPHTIRVTISNLRETKQHPAQRYRMLSIPLDLEAPMTGILTDDVGGPDNTRWRLFGYDTSREGYVELPNDSVYSFEQGRGYWFVTRDRHLLDTGPAEGLSTPTDSVFALPLEKGWNLIGHPFAFPVAWDSMTVNELPMAEAEGTLVDPAVAWAGDRYVHNVGKFAPWEGYWVKNLTDSTVILGIPPSEGVSEVPLALASSEKGSALEGQWAIGISASSMGAVDDYNFVGVKHEAVTARDRHDRAEAPMCPGKSISLYFPHPKWEKNPGNYTVDFRGEYGELPSDSLTTSIGADVRGHIWRFDVAKSFSEEAAGDDVVLEFSGMEDVPTGIEIVLVDQEMGRQINLRDRDRYVFFQGEREIVAAEENARFVLLVGSDEFVDSQEDNLPKLPMQTVLHQNLPNPFNPSTIIRYELARAGRVTLRVYDVSGALVKVLEDRDHQAGRYEVGWNGDNERGEKVATGVYFYRLTTKDFMATKKMLVLK